MYVSFASWEECQLQESCIPPHFTEESIFIKDSVDHFVEDWFICNTLQCKEDKGHFSGEGKRFLPKVTGCYKDHNFGTPKKITWDEDGLSFKIWKGSEMVGRLYPLQNQGGTWSTTQLAAGADTLFYQRDRPYMTSASAMGGGEGVTKKKMK